MVAAPAIVGTGYDTIYHMAAGDLGGTNEKLSRQLLKSLSNEFDPESIHTLNLSRQNLSDISVISKLNTTSEFQFLPMEIFKVKS